MCAVRNLSDKLFVFGTGDEVRSSRQDTAKAKRQRQKLLEHVRLAVLEDDKELLSLSLDASFSKHGSLYHRLTGPELNDVDVYVVLNGWDICWGRIHLEGRNSRKNVMSFTLPLTADMAVAWMCNIMKSVLRKWGVEYRVERSKRGAKITAHGSPPRDYDIIPAFMYKDVQGRQHHVIPRNGQWEGNPTEVDMRGVVVLDKRFARDQANKILGYRDMVKLLKHLRDELGWEAQHGIDSFVIRFGVAEALEESASLYNQKRLSNVIGKLNQWISRGYFIDPYTKERKILRGGEIFWDDGELRALLGVE